MSVNDAAARALRHVRSCAEARAREARARIARALGEGEGAHETERRAREAIARNGRVTLSFHPDRVTRAGTSVVEGLRADGRYKSQFETGISSGSRTAFPGGDRDRWERALFGGAYHDPPVTASTRPCYGALDLLGTPDGPSPRFGSCFLVLRPHVTRRASFCQGDSHLGPAVLGTEDAFDAILAAQLESLGQRDGASAEPDRILAWIARLEAERRSPADAVGRELDDYVEAQVHGGVTLGDDVEELVIDPSFDGTRTGVELEALGRVFGFPVTRHPGFVLDPDRVPEDFRGPRVASLARRIAARHACDLLDAKTLGLAARDLSGDAEPFADLGTRGELEQYVKQLWHVLVRFGRSRG